MSNIIKNLPHDTNYLISSFVSSDGILHRIYLSKSYFTLGQRDQYFLKLMRISPDFDMRCEAYIYFYINQIKNSTEFIGAFTDYQNRNKGYASLLFSSYIKLCLDEGINEFTTNRKQRKPFLLYMLKTYFYELKNINLYEVSPNLIYICKKNNDTKKYLLFKNKGQEETFKHGKIMEHDNYYILDFKDEDTIILDKILLSQIYRLDPSSQTEAYQKSISVLKRHIDK